MRSAHQSRANFEKQKDRPFGYIHGMQSTTPQSFHAPGAALRRHHRHPVHGHTPRLRPLAAADHPGPGLDPRDLLLRDGHPEPVLGRVRHLRRHGGRPLRRLPRHHRRRRAVCAGPGRHGAVRQRPDVHPDRRRPDRRGPGRHHLCGDLRRDRPQHPGRQTLLGHGRGGGGRLLRPVPDGAGRRLPDQRPGLEGGAAGAQRRGAADRAAGLRPARNPLRPAARHRRASRPSCRRSGKPSSTRASSC